MLLELNDVSKSFGGVAALTGISFGVKQGEVNRNTHDGIDDEEHHDL